MADEPVEQTTNESDGQEPSLERKPNSGLVGEHRDLQRKYRELKSQFEVVTKAEEARTNANLSEVERLKKENDAFMKTIGEFEVSRRKQLALSKAKTKLGEGYTLDGVEERVMNAVGRLSYNEESVDDDVREIVDLAKRPRTTTRSPIVTTATKGASFDPLKMNGRDLAQLQKDDPDEFKRVIAARRNNSLWPERSTTTTNFQPAQQQRRV